ncbi:MAG: SPOR domain-containing protein [Chitinophagales bacterium]
MKKVVGTFILIIFIFAVKAQYSYHLNDKVQIDADFDLAFMLVAHLDKNEHRDKDSGYRIQLINSSNRDEVYTKKTELYQKHSNVKAYIVYDQPYYKLRIGDFKTRLEAYKYMDEIIGEFQSAFVVRDEIKIK